MAPPTLTAHLNHLCHLKSFEKYQGLGLTLEDSYMTGPE